MSADTTDKYGQLIHYLEAITNVARGLQKNRRGLAAMIADPAKRPTIEAELADLIRLQPALSSAAREIVRTRDLLAKELKGRRRGFFA